MKIADVTYKFQIPTTTEWTSVETEDERHVVYYNAPDSDQHRTRLEGYKNHAMAVAVAAKWAIDRTAYVFGAHSEDAK